MRFLSLTMLLMFACTPSPSADVSNLSDVELTQNADVRPGDASGDDPCCCAFIREGDFDIISEDLRSRAVCPTLDQGACVDPETIEARITPHPCCPDATGERCGD